MRVTTHCNSQTQQRQQTSCHDKGFADMYASMAAHRHCQPEHGGHSHHGHARPEHSHHGHAGPDHGHHGHAGPEHGHHGHAGPDHGYHGHGEPDHGHHCHGRLEHVHYSHGMPYHGGGCQIRPVIHVVQNCHSHCVRLGRLTPHRQEPQPGLIIQEGLPGRKGDISAEDWAAMADRKNWPDQRVIPWNGVKASAPKRPASIYDIPARSLESELLAAQQACRNMRTEGLTQDEINKRIESIYIDFLGKDFKNAGNAASFDPYERTLAKAASEFKEQINRHNPSMKNPQPYINMKGFNGMSGQEMRTALRAQYATPMTLRECMAMAYELKELGLEDVDYGLAIRERIVSTMNSDWNDSAEQLYQAMLEMPADFDTIKATCDNSAKGDDASNPATNIKGLLKQMMSLVSGDRSTTHESIATLRDIWNVMEQEGIVSFDEIGHGGSSKK